MKLLELGQGPIWQIRDFAFFGETNETAGQERQRAAAVGEDPANVRKAHCGSGEHEMRNGPRGIGCVFDRRRRYAGNEPSAAIRGGGVDIDHRLAPIQFLVDRGKRGIAEILGLVTGQQADAVRLEHFEGVFDLLEAALHVGWRDDCKQAEPAGVVSHEPRAVLVELTREPARLLDIVSVPHSRLGNR